ncbi:hypothetical protein [Burkholderia diffusa]|uniref:Uncharacterized protein n=1 Tax=Burkholderia diffusa TaxID=488732 RepID=A0A6P2RGE4_9BURK|nr:hypothetical protein [Burkholderia diffusa]MBM2657084.1 hypothetical protein [Burkholderia diffusa]VWC30728.1 hypothetical protein BDI24065_06365 [Burkholderia diffusa]
MLMINVFGCSGQIEMSAFGYMEMSAFGPRKLTGRRVSGAGGAMAATERITMTMRELDRFKSAPERKYAV